MPSLDDAFGIHELALKLRSQRTELLASNLANADTPNYKARDIDFQSVLANYQAGSGAGLRTTSERHLGGNGTGTAPELLYREPMQASVDGNTVDPQVEKSRFMENALNYQATLSFIDGRMKTLKKALGGQ
jgi:flagellar basal-body rod protein FlgB